MTPSGVRHRIYGVDFSGSKIACNKIWISEAVVQNGILRIISCYPVRDIVPDNKKDRDSCLLALRSLISSSKDSVFGMDFPFSLPGELMFADDWKSFILEFAERYTSPEHFRNEMKASMQNRELKRLTDTEVKAPFCVYNLRLYRQTFFGIRDVLLPLLKENSACMIPMHGPTGNKPWLIEICPASTLKKEELYIPYKGKSLREKQAREYILEEIQKKGIVTTPAIRDLAVNDHEGDALDSMIAAFAASKAVPGLEMTLNKLPDIYRLEGYTFY
ncbi:hypothetical protein [Methanolobus halotolerans]|uniref:DUF429 domain-containing protein n=1 Tax=Methanolobus halotolerans TaxID=2052935 RepID=A0A4E0Q8C5_9EURY|nr:hypothetical protein [Methanolobus halotolerans]TGC11056.1 hypothetical protein CUN85_02585 [Methanolobus halotolerans]